MLEELAIAMSLAIQRSRGVLSGMLRRPRIVFARWQHAMRDCSRAVATLVGCCVEGCH